MFLLVDDTPCVSAMLKHIQINIITSLYEHYKVLKGENMLRISSQETIW